MITEVWEEPKRGKTEATWITADEYSGEEPLVQAYGMCVAGDLVCVLRSPETGNTILPGGTIEQGEEAEETLRREVHEEANLELGRTSLLGVQRVEFENHHDGYNARTVYQARFAAEIERADFITEDPAEGFLFERCFIPIDEVADVLGWGPICKELERLTKAKGFGSFED